MIATILLPILFILSIIAIVIIIRFIIGKRK